MVLGHVRLILERVQGACAWFRSGADFYHMLLIVRLQHAPHQQGGCLVQGMVAWF